MSKRKSSAKQNVESSNGAIARDSLRNIRRISDEKLCNLHEIDTEQAFSLSYLRRQFTNTNALEILFNRYTERISHTYFSIFLLIQLCFSITHFVLVFSINLNSKTLPTVIPDLILYSIVGLTSLITLYYSERRVKNRSDFLKIISIIVFLLVLVTDLFVPIFYNITSINYNLRPAYTVHLLIACYVFCNIKNNVYALLLGAFITVSHLFTLGFITYQNYRYIWERLGSDLVFLLCVNGLGICFRYANELVKRRAFLDHRGSVESTLKLKYEKEQQEQLMSSIIPEHIIKEVRQDILNKIEYIEKTLQIPIIGPKEIPYVHEYDNVTILYADIVNYTAMTSELPVKTLVETLNDLFSGFDEASEKLKVLRIKFLGDCYYCVAGLPPNPAPNHAEACIDLGLKMISLIRFVREKRKLSVDMRIGVHSGKILSGLIGSTKWQFDIWSKDVYLANKMETAGEAGKVHITQQTRNLIQKSYNIISCDKGSTDPNLVPYNVTTYLISPEPTFSDMTTTSILPPRKSVLRKKLSMIGEVNPDIQNNNNNNNNSNNNHLEDANGFVNSGSELPTPNGNVTGNSILDYDTYDGMPQIHFERRESVQSSYGAVINRRPSGNPALSKGIVAARRITPGDIKRRTAFMDNNIKRYQQRLKDTDQKIKEAIDEMPLSLHEQWFKVKGISPFFLIFKNFKTEWSYVNLEDPLFKFYLLIYVLIFVSIIVIQNLTQPRWEWGAWVNYGIIILIVVILVPFAWFPSFWIKYFASNVPNADVKPKNVVLRALYNASSMIAKNVLIRIVIYFTMFSLFIACVLEELIICQEHNTSKSDIANVKVKHLIFILLTPERTSLREHCILPWHISHTFALAIFITFLFITIHTWIKFILASGITILYSISVWNFNNKLYEDSETFNYMMESQIAHIMSLVFLTITLHMMDRQTDYLNRLDFQWNKKLISEQTEVNTMHRITTMLLKNILPIRVAELYLDVYRSPSPKELYSEEYDKAAVIFASVVDYPMDVFTEQSFLKFMNYIIKEFDHLLLKPRLRPIEKIKVANMTYMAACGLEPNEKDAHHPERFQEHVAVTLVKFAAQMMKKLQQINVESLQECKLRIGICHGEVMAGVVGSKKPLYDIWGDTVNLASRMDSTGVPGRIQVTENTAKVLLENGIDCEFRDLIFVKGKKHKVPTYFVNLTEDFNFVYSTDL